MAELPAFNVLENEERGQRLSVIAEIIGVNFRDWNCCLLGYQPTKMSMQFHQSLKTIHLLHCGDLALKLVPTAKCKAGSQGQAHHPLVAIFIG